MGAEIVPFGMPRPVAEELIHKLAAEGKYSWGEGFARKLTTRGFSMRQVIETLKSGRVNQGPTLDENRDWRCRVKKRTAGRLVRIVVAIIDQQHLDLISVH